MCCLHGGIDIAQMGKSGIQLDRVLDGAAVKYRCVCVGVKSVMTELCVSVPSVCSGVGVIEFSLIMSKSEITPQI